MTSVGNKSAEEILESIFAPSPRTSPLVQAEQTLRNPKKAIFVAMSNRNFFWRMHVTKFVLDEGMVPLTPFMMFDYYLMHTVDKEVVRTAINNLIARCDEVWVFGRMSLGVKVQVGIAKRMNKPVRFFDISELPTAVFPISRETAEEDEGD